MEIYLMIAGYILTIGGMLLIRNQGMEYSHKKALGLSLFLLGAVALFFVAWWHILVAFVISGIIVGVLSGMGKK